MLLLYMVVYGYMFRHCYVAAIFIEVLEYCYCIWLYMDRCLDHCYVADIFIEVLECCYCIWLYMDICLDHCYVAAIFIEVFRILLLYMVVYG